MIPLLLSKSTKRKAATAAGGFLVANPLMGAFVIGIGAAIWWGYRRRQQPRY